MQRLSKGRRASGKIKSRPEDFVVEEIASNGTVLKVGEQYDPQQLGLEEKEGEFAVFVMQKTGWNTAQALKAVAQKANRGMKSVGFAGTKDRMSVSTQLCSIFGADPNFVKSIKVKDISINGAWRSDKKIELGMLAGNHFKITVREPKGIDSVQKNAEQLNGVFPNYFGSQRFGSRGNNFEIGLSILKGDFEGAAMRFLTDTTNEKNAEATEARKRLEGDHDFTAALDYFPMHLRYERTVLDYLSRYERNFANALRRLPRSIVLMFVHSVEDSIFNAELEMMIGEGHTSPMKGDKICAADETRFYDLSDVRVCEKGGKGGFIVGNIVGYETKEPTEFEAGKMEEYGLTTDSFKAKSMSELGSKGARRVMFAPFKGFKERNAEDTHEISFSLPSGSYATVLLDELVESKADSTDTDKYPEGD